MPSLSLRIFLSACCFLLALLVTPTIASEGPPPVLNPKDYSSPNGKVVLHVNPSDLHGRGKATYDLKREGKTVWSGDKPYTLWDAAITDDGVVAGYAYTHGWRGYAKKGGYQAGMGDFHVVIIKPDGTELINKVTKREDSRFLHCPPTPLANGMAVDAQRNRFVVRLSDLDVNRRTDAYWVFDLATGKKLDKKPGMEIKVVSPFADPAMRKGSPTSQPVREIKLEPSGSLVLRSASPTSANPIRGVRDFVFNDRGHIAFIRDEQKSVPTLIVLDVDGKMLSETTLSLQDNTPESGDFKMVWVGNNYYVVTHSTYGTEEKARGWRVDCKSREIKSLKGFDCPFVDAIDSFPDGRFVILGTMHYSSTMTTTVYAFDAQGNRLWKLQHAYDDEPSHLFSPEGLAVTTDGRVVVLDVIRHTLQFFDGDGQFKAKLSLDTTWGKPAGYPSDVAADVQGGCIVHDFSGSPPIYRMLKDGKVRSKFQPRHKDGRTFDLLAGVKAAPDGRLWTCDGYSLLRLTDDGVVDLVLGESPSSNELNEVTQIFVDPSDKLYAVAARTSTVHVFSNNGDPLFTAMPDPSDVKGILYLPHIAFGRDGDFYLGGGIGRGGYIHFSAEGKRIEVESRINDSWYIQPNTGRSWQFDYNDVYLLDEKMNRVATISRRADGNWLENPHCGSVAQDGGIAIVAYPMSGRGGASVAVNLYQSTGDPIRTIDLPVDAGGFPRVAYDGHRIVVAGDNGLFLFKSPEFSPTRLDTGITDFKKTYWCPHIVQGGTELWLFDANTHKPVLQRYKLPS